MKKNGTNDSFLHYASVLVTYARTSLLIFSIKNSGKTIEKNRFQHCWGEVQWLMLWWRFIF